MLYNFAFPGLYSFEFVFDLFWFACACSNNQTVHYTHGDSRFRTHASWVSITSYSSLSTCETGINTDMRSLKRSKTGQIWLRSMSECHWLDMFHEDKKGGLTASVLIWRRVVIKWNWNLLGCCCYATPDHSFLNRFIASLSQSNSPRILARICIQIITVKACLFASHENFAYFLARSVAQILFIGSNRTICRPTSQI
jgi:hypothetical protein